MTDNAITDNAITFVHLTDTHISPQPENRIYGADTFENFRRVIERVKEMDLHPAFFLISGDLSQGGEPESYERFALLHTEVERFGVPVLLGMGNHDTRVAFRRVILGDAMAEDEDVQYYHSQLIQGIRVTMLDSKVPGALHGHLGEAQLTWLAEQLEQPAPLGHLLVVHHPVVPRGVPRENDYLIDDAEKLAEVIANRPVLGVLAGHTHVSTAASFAGTLAVNGPSTAFQLDPSIRSGGRMLAGAGFNVGTIRDGRLLVNPVYLPTEQEELFRYFPKHLAQYETH